MSELLIDEVHPRKPYEMPCEMTYQVKANCMLTSPLLHGGLFMACLPMLKQYKAHALISGCGKNTVTPVG